MHKDFIFREYDIRGVYNGDFDKDFAYQLGQSFACFLNEKGCDAPTVTIGHDARLSSPEISQALIDGLTSSGVKVIFLGLITTPISYFSMFQLEAQGGIMVTGSHNPPDYNGFKISFGKTTLFGNEIQRLREILAKGDFLKGEGKKEDFDIFPAYVERYKKEFTGLEKVSVVLDCGNGAAGCIARRLFEAVGLKPQILFEEPDGRFPNHHPDPTVESNLTSLKDVVTETKADIGIGFDGDCDRIGVIDNTGKFLLGDELMVIWARDVLANSPGEKIIGDVKCSDRMYADIEKHGGKPIMWKTGHSLVKNKIKQEKAPFGGELSGHIFFADRNYGYDDALYAGLRLIEIIAKTGKSMDELLEGLPPSFSTPEIRLDTTEEKKGQIVEKLKQHFEKMQNVELNFIDGVRVSYLDGWALVRASNTQPVVVVRFESQSDERLIEIQNSVMEIVEPLL